VVALTEKDYEQLRKENTKKGIENMERLQEMFPWMEGYQ